MLIRPAVEADDAAVGALLVEAFLSQYERLGLGIATSAERLADLRDQAEKRANACVLVAEDGGRVVGTVSLYPPGAPRSEAWIPGAADLRLLGIDAAHQGKGLSGRLMDAAEALARTWNVPAICLHTRREAAGVARLYVRRGYLRDPSGDIDHLPYVYLEAYYLSLSGEAMRRD